MANDPVGTKRGNVAKLIFFLLFLVAMFLLDSQPYPYWEDHQAQSWPSTTAQIVAGTVVNTRRGRSTFHCVQWTYSYSVEGTEYTKSQWRFVQPAFEFCSLNRSEAVSALGRRSKGSPLAVRYDPTQPDRAVVEPAGYADWLKTTVPAGILLFGLLISLLVVAWMWSR